MIFFNIINFFGIRLRDGRDFRTIFLQNDLIFEFFNVFFLFKMIQRLNYEIDIYDIDAAIVRLL